MKVKLDFKQSWRGTLKSLEGVFLPESEANIYQWEVEELNRMLSEQQRQPEVAATMLTEDEA